MDCRCSQFGCSICLDTASDAVVSRCGHLYCASCLKHWLDTGPDNQFCPVCKAAISWREVIRVYGQGDGDGGPSSIPSPQTSEANTAVQQGTGPVDGGVSSPPRPASTGEIVARLRHFREVLRNFLRTSSRSSFASEDEDDDGGDVEAGDEDEEIARVEDEDDTDENDEVSAEEQDDDEESDESGDATQEDVTGSEIDGVGRADDVVSDIVEVIRGLRLENDDLEYYSGPHHVPSHAYYHSEHDDDFGGAYLGNGNDEELVDDPYVPPQDYYQSDYDDDFNHDYDYLEDDDDYF